MINNLLQTESHYPVFQPLVHLATEQIIGYEALLRSTTQVSPEQLFRFARTADRLYDLDILSIRRAISFYDHTTSFASGSPQLFINVFPSTLLNPAFSAFLDEDLGSYRSLFGQMVLEINEANEEDKMWELRLLGQKVRELRQKGFLIALDDVGAGAASLKKIIEYEPDIIKLDRYFGNHLSSNSAKQKLVSLFVQFCAGQIQLVLEGIEEPMDLAAAQSIGVPIGQGFLLGIPTPL